MELQKRLAAQTLKCGPGRIKFDPTKLSEIEEAITAFDILRLINKGYIRKLQAIGVSRGRAKKRAAQRRKGRQSGHGKRKGGHKVRQQPKTKWVRSARAQRTLAKTLKVKEHINNKSYREIYAKIKGGFFRSVKHIKLFIQEKGMTKK